MQTHCRSRDAERDLPSASGAGWNDAARVLAAADRDDLSQDRDRDLVGRDGAEIEAGGRLELAETVGRDASLCKFPLESLGFFAAADEGDVVGVDGERRQKCGF